MGKVKHVIPILVTLFIVFIFYFKRFVFLKFYPPLCNFTVFMVFFCSLFAKETVIQKFARACGDKLDKPAWTYTRNLTYVWCVFMLINLLISIYTIFLSDAIWMLYNGCISYILVGSLFAIEYLVRIILRKRNLIWC